MRWRGRKQSDNVEDRRGGAGEGAGLPFPFPGGGRQMRWPQGTGAKRGGIGGLGLIVLIGLFLLFGGDFGSIFQDGLQQQQFPDLRLPEATETADRTATPRQTSPSSQAPRSQTAEGDDLKPFVAVVLADTEEVWHTIFSEYGRSYVEPKLVLFTGYTRSGCGQGIAAMGPFYCPLDRKVYVDLAFFRELRTRFKAPGDFAQAYVIAHEVGHHVQTLLGVTDKVQQVKARSSQSEADALQVRMELQADCLAGLWAHHAQRTKAILEEGDLDEALNAASAIGDDRIQKQTQGYVVPDAFTHGSSEQRVRWFRRGFRSGSLQDCDTFNADRL